MSEFWVFALSGMVVAWPPIIISFVVHHWRIKVYIDKKTRAQTGDIRRLTDYQTEDIKAITDLQTAKLTDRRRLRRGQV